MHRAPQRALKVEAQVSPAVTRSVALSCTAFPPLASLAPILTPVRGTTYQIKLPECMPLFQIVGELEETPTQL